MKSSEFFIQEDAKGRLYSLDHVESPFETCEDTNTRGNKPQLSMFYSALLQSCLSLAILAGLVKVSYSEVAQR